MPSDPTRETILAAIKARLAAIATGGTYFYTPCAVERDWRHVQEIKDGLAAAGTITPWYGVVEGPEERPALTFTNIKATLRAFIIGWISDDADRRTVVNRAIADVIRAIYTDETFGLSGVVLATHVREIATDEAAVVAKPHAYFEIMLEIEYVVGRTAA